MQEEEDRELQQAMEATGMSIYPDEYVDRYLGFRRERMMSLGNVSAPPILNRGYRFSSIGKWAVAVCARTPIDFIDIEEFNPFN